MSRVSTTTPAPYGSAVATDEPLDLLVWDAPNIDATLAGVIGGRPSSASRPRFDAIARWFVQGSGGRDVEGCVFTNIAPGQAASVRGWVEALRASGFAVFAKPKLQSEDDIDDAMLDHIALRVTQRPLRRLVVASADGRNFLEPMESYARDGVECLVIAFSEVAGYAQESPLIEFLDLEDVPGAFTTPLNRTRLDALPPQGAWLQPTRSLRSMLEDA